MDISPNADFHGPSPAKRRLEEQIARQSKLTIPLLIEGERGVGKKRAARAVRLQSPWKSKPCFEIDLTDSDTDPESGFPDVQAFLPGGAFLILEEVGAASRLRQDQLWRWLRSLDRASASFGGIRTVSTCEGSLGKLVALRRFRADLYLRLRVGTIELPTLAERREDIPHLVREFLAEFAAQSGEPPKMLTAEAMDWTLSFSWPGNVAQLKHEILRAAASTSSRAIAREDLRPDLLLSPDIVEDSCVRESCPLQERVEEFERNEVLRTLQSAGGMRDRAAQILGIDRRTLQRKLRRWRQSTTMAIPPEAS